jgi:uncharacterized protein
MSNRRLLIIFLLLLLASISLVLPLSSQDDINCDEVLEIWQIQGSQEEPNCLRKRITTENNIITAVGIRGFFIQTPAERSDNDITTSDGVYVSTNLPPARYDIKVGDLVNVTGRIVEFYFLTQIEAAPTRVEIISSDNPLPEPIDLTTVDLTPGTPHPLERYEGMYVQIINLPAVASTNKFDEFGVTLDGSGRAFREPGIEIDDTPQLAGLGLPEWDLNPQLLEIDPAEMGLPVEQIALGSRATAKGGLSYSYLDYQLWPSEIEVFPVEYEARPVRERQEGEFIIATQNVENLFDIIDDPDRDDSVFDDYVPRDEGEYQIRIAKASQHIRIILGAPDILAIQEIENQNVVNNLVEQIQADDPSLQYTGCIFEGHDGRGIDNAYLVRTDRVNLVDCQQMPGAYEARARDGGDLYGRPPLVLEAELITADGVFPITLINLHIRSLNGGETQRVQDKRMMQAVGVAEYIQGRVDENPDINLVVLGDLNAFQFTDGLVDVVGIISGDFDPAEAMTAPAEDTLEPNLINQVMRVAEDDRYSYVFSSNSQVLDHILTTPALDAYVSDAQFSRGNSDALTIWYLDLDKGSMRISDHDGFVIYVRPE